MSSQQWDPDCLDRFLGCWKNSPKSTAATGYYLLRVIYSIITVHSAIIFASVITYAALQVTGCLPSSDSGSGSCGSATEVDDENTHRCRKLWGLIKPDSLLTVIGTISAIILAVSAALVGTAMDATPFRRQIGLVGNILIVAGMLLCISIVKPTSTTLAISSVGLVVILVFKDYVTMQVDSYAPELSAVPAEIGSAISGGFTWSLISNVLLMIIWSVVGMGLSNSTYGFSVTVGSAALLIVASLCSYRRLPNVPAAHPLPANTTLTTYTVRRFWALCAETYSTYPDLGLLLISGMIFDPALSSLFAAAVLILVSKYQFTANQVTIILGLAIVAAIPAVPLSRWVASTSRLNWLFGDCNSEGVVEPTPGLFSAKQDEADGYNGSAGVATEGDVGMVNSPSGEEESAATTGDVAGAAHESAGGPPVGSEIETAAKVPRFHPKRIKIALFWALWLTVTNTILVVQILPACDMGLACLFGCLWGFLLSYCWNCLSMLRMSLVPGGRESEFAGLYLAIYSSMIWLPLLVFSVANELWSIDGALYVLTAFFGVGAVVLLGVDVDRALNAREATLSMRRWASLLPAMGNKEGNGEEDLEVAVCGAAEMGGLDHAGKAAHMEGSSELGTAEESSAAGGSCRLEEGGAGRGRWALLW
jgi:hypothetical protein